MPARSIAPTAPRLFIEDAQIAGYRTSVSVRSYLPSGRKQALPVIVYLHGGGFTRGTLDDAETAATTIAATTPAWVISVDYPLAPSAPFPLALEDVYCAVRWAIANAKAQGADPRRIGIAGDDAGGNLATALSAMARDRGDFALRAQALLAPLLDPSLTRLAEPGTLAGPRAAIDSGALHDAHQVHKDCARGYRAYLPELAMRLHPYAAPLESKRLTDLPPALVASAQHDLLRHEAEVYAGRLIEAGVPTEVRRYIGVTHRALVQHADALRDVAAFFRKWLAPESLLRMSDPMPAT
ncbi:alpha/beta hydrolase [Chitinasiproducens palmae]|uniref:Acetyl esterase/lipase n=1 Tax=Chitinasiproducens palmae TaxID=1770053 RepID=A0A1H2PU40_9BURK|nr:alpha/beta hydrolase [Chitinasiproducens palmae]SDV50649.1 Acetyl esterase/lipase [Chitinasiproducens palmae]